MLVFLLQTHPIHIQKILDFDILPKNIFNQSECRIFFSFINKNVKNAYVETRSF